MNNPSRRLEWIVWGSIGLAIAAIVAAFVVTEVRRDRRPPLPVFFEVPAFTLTNQAGVPFDTASLRGQVWLADIIFTRCPGPCARMTRRVAELQAALPAGAPVRFVTLTTDPLHDTPPVLAAYARSFGADPSRWQFLTGTKAQIGFAATNCLKLTALDKEAAKMESPNDLFIHSTILVVIDKQSRVRAIIENEPGETLPPEESLRELVRTNALPIIERLLKESRGKK